MPKRMTLLFILSSLICRQLLLAQWYDFLKADFRHAWNMGLQLACAPGSFETRDWAKLGLATGGTLALMALDKSVQHVALDNQSKLGDAVFRLDKYYGNEKTMYYCVGIYGVGLAAGNIEIRRLGLRAAEAVVYSNVVTSFFKSALGRRRPYAGESNLFFAPFRGGEVYHSLPSGHATASFAFATVLAEYQASWLWRTCWYGSAFVIAGARIYHNKHWVSDVVAGGMIGYSVGRFIAHYDAQKRSGEAHIAPVVGFRQVGMVYSF